MAIKTNWQSGWEGKRYYPYGSRLITWLGKGAVSMLCAVLSAVCFGGTILIVALIIQARAALTLDILSIMLLCVTLGALALFIPIGVISIFGAIVILRSEPPYLLLSPEGIIYHSPGQDIQTSWANIRSIGPLMGSFLSEGFLLRQPPISRGPLFLGRARAFIPLSMWFGIHWREKEVGLAIREYAPHLFND